MSVETGKEDQFMEKSLEEADGETSRGFWLGGEAVVRRYPRKRDITFRLTRSITGLLALALGLGCVGGLWAGYQWCAWRTRRLRG
jgi:hypothetical protein